MFANKTWDHITLCTLRGHFGDLTMTHWCPRTPELRSGHIGAQPLENVVDDVSGLFYLCGPPEMEKGGAEALTAKGVSEDQLIQER